MTAIKEINFFSNTPTLINPIRATTLEEYEHLFAGARTESARGEVSPSYIESEVAPQRIHDLIPDVRLIASIRNPVDRVYSEFRSAARSSGRRRTPEEALHPNSPSVAAFVARARLSERLQTYHELFDRDQIRIYRFEDLRDPSTLRDMYEHIGVDPSFQPDTETVYNRGWTPRSETLNWITRVNPVAQRVRTMLPQAVRLKLQKLRQFNETSGSSMSVELRADLTLYFREDIERTQELTDLDLTRWLEH